MLLDHRNVELVSATNKWAWDEYCVGGKSKRIHWSQTGGIRLLNFIEHRTISDLAQFVLGKICVSIERLHFAHDVTAAMLVFQFKIILIRLFCLEHQHGRHGFR
jgi:hypothetical protein